MIIKVLENESEEIAVKFPEESELTERNLKWTCFKINVFYLTIL